MLAYMTPNPYSPPRDIGVPLPHADGKAVRVVAVLAIVAAICIMAGYFLGYAHGYADHIKAMGG